tara:strand:- start:50316 stop:52682 length:2367 start_codon:yes stop_codon:yes gene_type:complete
VKKIKKSFTNLRNKVFSKNKLKILAYFLFVISLLLFVSFISFFFNWKIDSNNIYYNSWAEVISNKEIIIANSLGKIGALISHKFIFMWFGICAFTIPFFISLLSLRLFKIKTFDLLISFTNITLTLIYVPVFISHFFGATIFSGSMGHYISIFLIDLFGTFGSSTILMSLLILYLSITFEVDNHKLKRLFDKLIHFKNMIISIRKNKIKSVDDNGVVLNELETNSIGEINTEEENEGKNEILQKNVQEDLDIDDNNTDTEELDVKVNVNQKENILSSSEIERKLEELGDYDPTLELSSFQVPKINILKDYGDSEIKIDKEELENNKTRIVETLGHYNIKIDSISATIGPTITLYEIVPEAGTRINKIKNLEDDIALSLAAEGIRIIAPIPGKGTIGIEVPNKNKNVVSMKEVISSEKFQENDMALPIAFGKTISNETFVIDLAKMPHLLMAGATGQGKSVGLNVILTSLLYKKHPAEIKFVLVDPKKVELTLFNKIERHFLAKLPDSEDAIITDTKKVVNTINSLCIEMDERYELCKKAQCRNIKEYNSKFISRKLNPNDGHKYLPYIVLVIDEFADLIMTAGKEIETPISRLAQLARAIGIHLIVATQRPSVNVITGLIKANFPARVAFRVTSKIDSRTILDAGGADQLIGMGDMLISTGSEMTRLQCAFVDTPEVDKLCEFIGNQKAYPDAHILPEYIGDSEGSSSSVDLNDRDSLFEEAAKMVLQHQSGSTSLIQRKLKLGYNRAGRIIDQLEAAGIVGPFEGSKARQVLVKDELSLQEILNQLN